MNFADDEIFSDLRQIRKEKKSKKKEEQRKARDQLFDEWEHIQVNIRQLCK